jgi:hypothetical protein
MLCASLSPVNVKKTMLAQQALLCFTERNVAHARHSLRISSCHYFLPALNALRALKQRRRELEALYSLDYWDVELVEDEQWGRVLVAQRDFAPGKVVVRSGVLLEGRTVAECVREFNRFHQASPNNSGITAQYLQWATSSPRCAA